jgi:hypothetical protein
MAPPSSTLPVPQREGSYQKKEQQSPAQYQPDPVPDGKAGIPIVPGQNCGVDLIYTQLHRNQKDKTEMIQKKVRTRK